LLLLFYDDDILFWLSSSFLFQGDGEREGGTTANRRGKVEEENRINPGGSKK
jgi:hypothetical protein